MTTKPLNIALLPLEIKWMDKAHNIATLIDALNNLHPDTDLLVLPETFSTGFPVGLDKEAIRPYAERNTGKTIDTIKALSKKFNVAIAGSFVADSGGLLYNRAFFIEPNGDETFADKKHLFTMAGEHNNFSAGNNRMSVRYRGWNISMVVCYDVRFPVWCRNKQNEYDLLIAVANWPKARAEAWRNLLLARAIENEAYVCGVDCFGTDNGGWEYEGDSFIFDFKGKEINSSIGKHNVIYAQLSAEKLESFRTKFPAWKDADDFSLNP